MQPELIVSLRKGPFPGYKPVLSRRERLAYHAAHRILTEQTVDPRMACPGGRRSAQLDKIAAIIQETYARR